MSENEMFDELTKKAEQGDAEAQYALGFMYKWGEGVEQDYKKAFEWYTKAAEQGNSDALYTLGVMYEKGDGTSKNIKKAIEYYEMASQQGEEVSTLLPFHHQRTKGW